MRLIKKEKDLFLQTEYTTGNKAYCAFITGLDPKWKYAREFINKTRKGLKITPVNEDDIIEERIYSHSGKNYSQTFYKITDGTLQIIKEEDLLLSLQ